MREVIRELLSAYPGLAGLEDAVPMNGGFSGARIFKISSLAGAFCLRQWPADGLPAERIHELHRWLRHLSTCGLPVTVPLTHRSGDALLEHRGRYWQLECWVEGSPLEPGAATEPRIRNAMATLARLHLASEQYVATSAGRTWFSVAPQSPPPAILERRRQVAEWPVGRLEELLRTPPVSSKLLEPRPTIRQAIETAVRLRATVLNELERCEELRAAAFPCWRDLWRAHVLYRGDSVTGLIDASAARMDHPATDLARLLGSLAAETDIAWDTALANYEVIRPLSEADRRLVSIFDRSGIWLSVLHWVQRLASGAVPSDSLDRVHARLQEFMKRLETL